MQDRVPSLLQRNAFGPCPRLENSARRAQQFPRRLAELRATLHVA
jgi:hypothetical protein